MARLAPLALFLLLLCPGPAHAQPKPRAERPTYTLGEKWIRSDGVYTVQELYEYVEQQVSVKLRSVGGNQHPVMKGEMEGALPLVRVR
ncbi:MAG: hypothetical protein HYR50_02985 [Candidatus Rokubacteria bacterium]|nr:hypothetical protein [Candidatus Rokubacteria bacterium]